MEEDYVRSVTGRWYQAESSERLPQYSKLSKGNLRGEDSISTGHLALVNDL